MGRAAVQWRARGLPKRSFSSSKSQIALYWPVAILYYAYGLAERDNDANAKH